jgi:hypothetical protein
MLSEVTYTSSNISCNQVVHFLFFEKLQSLYSKKKVNQTSEDLCQFDLTN